MGFHFYELYDNQDNDICDSVKSSYTFVVGFGFLPNDPEEREKRNLRRHGVIIAASLLFVLFTMIMVKRYYYLLMYLSNFFNGSLGNSLLQIFATVITFGCVLLIYSKVAKKDIGFSVKNKKTSFLTVLYGCIAMLGMSCLSGFATKLITDFLRMFKIYPMDKLNILPSTKGEIVLYYLAWCIVPSIFEELFFRGAMLESLRKFGDIFAITTTSLLFALVHGNLLQLPHALFSGILLGYFKVITGKLFVPILMHMINNAFWITLDIFGFQIKFVSLASFIISLLIVALITVGAIMLKKKNEKYELLKGNTALTPKKKRHAFFGSYMMLVFLAVVTVQIMFSVQMVV